MAKRKGIFCTHIVFEHERSRCYLVRKDEEKVLEVIQVVMREGYSSVAILDNVSLLGAAEEG
jgi:hypothetical protein